MFGAILIDDQPEEGEKVRASMVLAHQMPRWPRFPERLQHPLATVWAIRDGRRWAERSPHSDHIS